ncbi:MAG: J domain-containing protein [Chloroflexota bacterium]|nr:J domain-containing protein [Chloroflexota bacterium]
MPNYYETLGIHRNSDDKTIRQAYRRLAREHHPDVNQGDASAEEQFKAVNEAYSVLSDKDSRQKYDRYGDQWKQAGNFSSRQQHGTGMPFSFDPWSMFYGNPNARHSPNFGFDGAFDNRNFERPEPKEYNITISLYEAYSGATRTLKLSNGKRIEAKIPIGVASGSKIRMQGIPGQDTSFYLVIEILEHPIFKRLNNDLFTEVEAHPEQLVLGSELSIGTLTGDIALSVPPLTQNGQRFRLSGQGMPSLKSPNILGDLYVIVKVKLPSIPRKYEQEIYESLRGNRSKDTGE